MAMRLTLLSPMARSITAVVLGTLLLSLVSLVSKSFFENIRRSNSEALPHSLTLWAWDAPEDLSFLKNEDTAVAYYAGTITLQSKAVLFSPRRKPLVTPARLFLYPVFRIENPSQAVPPESAANEIANIVTAYMNLKSDKGAFVHDVQIDYDATQNERAFYVHLLKTLRQSLPSTTHIAITALTSWAMDDRWLPPGCADEAIVMLFSLGSETSFLTSIGKRHLSVGEGIDTSIGISVNEPITNARLSQQNVIQTAERIYIFNSIPWKRERYLETKNLVSNHLRISSLNK
jgi:Tfp pilus assembly protein PilN